MKHSRVTKVRGMLARRGLRRRRRLILKPSSLRRFAMQNHDRAKIHAIPNSLPRGSTESVGRMRLPRIAETASCPSVRQGSRETWTLPNGCKARACCVERRRERITHFAQNARRPEKRKPPACCRSQFSRAYRGNGFVIIAAGKGFTMGLSQRHGELMEARGLDIETLERLSIQSCDQPGDRRPERAGASQ